MHHIDRRTFVRNSTLLSAAITLTLATRQFAKDMGNGGDELKASTDGKYLTIASADFSITSCRPTLTVDGIKSELELVGQSREAAALVLLWQGAGFEMKQRVGREASNRLRITSELKNLSPRVRVLNHVSLASAEEVKLGPSPDSVRVLEQSFYFARVRTPQNMATGNDGLNALDGTTGAFSSDAVALFFNPESRGGLLIGYETFNRWRGQVLGRIGAKENAVQSFKGEYPFRYFALEFHGGDLPIQPTDNFHLEEVVFETGRDPDTLLANFADRIAQSHSFSPPPQPFASWCSWYPFRLSVSHGKIVGQAQKAKERSLDKLGLKFMQADLGWQKDNVPTYFEENERFPAGLEGLSADLRELGFQLGAWCGAVCVAATHPVAKNHPDWLLKKNPGDTEPHSIENWYWDPHPPIYALDVTHPEAREWLKQGVRKLAQAGVRYFKWDFAGKLTNPILTGRYDSQVVTAGLQGLRGITAEVQSALNEGAGENVLMLDCSGIDMAGTGITRLSYCVMDSGNTGFVASRNLQEIYTSYAVHLFKQRWALLQPSCLVVGLPGTLDEARIRATATFMGAGHVDLGDDLVTLPEERWNVLLATLPQNRNTARIVDLWEPIDSSDVPDLTGSSPEGEMFSAPPDHRSDGASVWTVPIKGGWDDWTLVAVFNWREPTLKNGVRLARRYKINLDRLGYARVDILWAYEFWSGQFLGKIPRNEPAAGAYAHKGDLERLVIDSGPGVLDVAFHGPTVKLIILRKPRAHPWPVGTSFHQSGGLELSGVKWHEGSRALEGNLHRPAGESGYLVIAIPGNGGMASGVRRIPITSTGETTRWRVAF
jgi:hypothetical protein